MTATRDAVLVDYTTLISAANALNCRGLVYPGVTRNPYEGLIAARTTPPSSPMWLEFASLADVLEALVTHEQLAVMTAVENDRILDRGRYQDEGADGVPLVSLLEQRGVLERIDQSSDSFERVLDWLADAAADPELLDRLTTSMLELLEQPAYRSIPDLFSHSQTVYKFDGESVWDQLRERLPLREFTRTFQRRIRELGFAPQLEYTDRFYAGEILAFFLRALLYNDLAKQAGIPYHPHPARAVVAMTDGLWSVGTSDAYAAAPVRFVRDLRSSIAGDQEAAAELFDLEMPPVFAAVLAASNGPEEIVPVALQMRDTASARGYREWVRETFGSGEGLKAVKAEAELKDLAAKLRRELGLDATSIGVSLWAFSFPVRVPPWLHRPLSVAPKRHLQFIRELTRAALDVMDLERELVRLFAL